MRDTGLNGFKIGKSLIAEGTIVFGVKRDSDQGCTPS
jgi:hypothetical protein